MAKKSKQEEVVALAKLEQSGPLAPWQIEAAEEAKAQAAAFQQGLARISFKGGRIQIDNQYAKDDTIRVIVVDAVLEKAYYTKAFKEGEPATPVCYGFHPTAREEIKPHEAAPEPQHEQCAGCKWNVFGTAIQQDGTPGKGKRCRDIVRGVAVVWDDKPGSLVKAEARGFSIPPTSLKPWGDYVSKLAGAGASFRTVVTQIKNNPFGSTFKLSFEALGRLDEQGYLAVKARQDLARAQLLAPYPALGEEPQPAKPQKKIKGQK